MGEKSSLPDRWLRFDLQQSTESTVMSAEIPSSTDRKNRHTSLRLRGSVKLDGSPWVPPPGGDLAITENSAILGWNNRGKAVHFGAEMPWRRGFPENLGKKAVGGDFYLVRTRAHYDTVDFPLWQNWLTGSWSGGSRAVLNRQQSIPLGSLVSPGTISELKELAPPLIADALPTNPSVSLPTAIAEVIKDGIPAMVGIQTWRDRALTAKQAGKEYLNIEFGWRPLVSDILAFAEACYKMSDIIDQYKRDSGKTVRRRRNLPVSTGGYVPEPSTVTLWPSDPNVQPYGPGMRAEDSYIQTWFTGAFQYYIGDNDLDRFRSYADRLFGISLNPEILWNIAPWTWALDWVSNIGSVVHNAMELGLDSTVMTYGYMMRREVVKTTYQRPYYVPGLGKSFGGPRPLSGVVFNPTMTLYKERFTRIRANPYGFSVSWDGLSVRQWAILAALGITRS